MQINQLSLPYRDDCTTTVEWTQSNIEHLLLQNITMEVKINKTEQPH